MKPRILMLADIRGWAYDVKAQSLIRYLNNFDVILKFVSEKPQIDPAEFDLLYVFWWGERYHRKFLIPKEKVVKEITSHRWEVETKYYCESPSEAKDRFMFDAGYLVAHSEKLKHLFDLKYIYNAGVYEALMRITRQRHGQMKIGWAGNPKAKIKRFDEIILPSVKGHEFLMADGNVSYEEMPNFYNQLDIICVASIAEGTPRPLLEGMACGCFPVTTDVGIAPELIKHGENGLIVEGNKEAFKEAFDWCAKNLDYVREAGKKNQDLIHATRTWKHSAQQFEAIIVEILNQNASLADENIITTELRALPVSITRITKPLRSKLIEFNYRLKRHQLDKRLGSLLPKNKLAKVLVLGEKTKDLLRFLSENGYYQLCGIVKTEKQYRKTMHNVGHKLEHLYLVEDPEHLNNLQQVYDVIIFNGLPQDFESFTYVKKFANNYLKHDGILILLTPNLISDLIDYASSRVISKHLDGLISVLRENTELKLKVDNKNVIIIRKENHPV